MNEYEDDFIKEIMMCLPHCEHMYVTRILLGLQSKDFWAFHEHVNEIMIRGGWTHAKHRLILLHLIAFF